MPAPDPCRYDRLRGSTFVCVAISVAMHALLLSATLPATHQPFGGHRHADSSGQRSKHIYVQLISPLEVAKTASPQPELTSDRRALQRPRQDLPAEAALMERPPTARPSAPKAAPPGESAGKAEDAERFVGQPGIPGPASTSSTQGGDEYIPRPLLSVPPIARGAVLIAPPVDMPDATTRTGILSLFIDEEGVVQRIEALEPLLPPALEKSARDAFMAARFKAGEVEGKAVKSRLRVEVSFERFQPSSP